MAFSESTLMKTSTGGMDTELLQSISSKGGEAGDVARQILSVHTELTTLNQSLREFLADLDQRA